VHLRLFSASSVRGDKISLMSRSNRVEPIVTNVCMGNNLIDIQPYATKIPNDTCIIYIEIA